LLGTKPTCQRPNLMSAHEREADHRRPYVGGTISKILIETTMSRIARNSMLRSLVANSCPRGRTRRSPFSTTEIKGVAHFSTEGSDGVHHAFMINAAEYQSAVEMLRARGLEIFFEEDRRGGVIDGPRVYFRDPDGNALEFINRTAYAGLP
jgi:hypothetical protein